MVEQNAPDSPTAAFWSPQNTTHEGQGAPQEQHERQFGGLKQGELVKTAITPSVSGKFSLDPT